jgi:hypothetical protein
MSERVFGLKMKERFTKKESSTGHVIYIGVGLRADHKQSDMNLGDGRFRVECCDGVDAR